MHSAHSDKSKASRKKISAWPLAFVLGLGACGYQAVDDRASLKADSARPSESFASWCESWQILCESDTTPIPDPIKLDAAKWTAITSVAKEALSNPISFSITRAEVDSPQLTLAIKNLGLTSDFDKLKTTLDKSQWQSLALESRNLVSRSAEAGTLKASNGLGFNAGQALSVSLGQNSAINVDGLSLSSKDGDKTSQLESLTLGEGNALNLGLADETVQNVPFGFLETTLASAFGFENATTEPVEFTRQQIISAAYPLLSWANKPQRTATLNHQFFTVASNELKSLLAKEDFGPAVLNFLSALDSAAVSATAGKDVVHVAQVSNAKLECNVNSGEAKVMFDKDFGLKRFYEVDGGVGLEFFGVKATARLALGIPLTLKRVEIRADKITVLDIPIIGKVEVPFDKIEESAGEKAVFACKK